MSPRKKVHPAPGRPKFEDRSKPRAKHLGLRLSPPEYESLLRAAEKRGVTVSVLVRQLIQEGVK